jgi:hypothetical protein
MKLTKQQREAVKRLYDRSPDGAVSYLNFRRRFRLYSSWQVSESFGSSGLGDYIGGQWCGMFIGIETDGHTHT